MKIALAQINPTVGAIEANLEKHQSFALRAKREGAEIVLFPELSLTGYPPRDLVDYPSFVDRNLDALKHLAKQASGITIVCGFIARNSASSGKPFFNSAAVLSEGKCLAVHHKQLLPYYDVFDECRYFEPGNGSCVFSIGGKKIGLTICEDGWNFPGFLKRAYEVHPMEALRASRVDLIVNISASPFHLGKSAQRIQLLKETAKFVGAPIAFCNQIGGNDELLFDGASAALSHQGEALAYGPTFKEDLVVYSLGGEAPAVNCPWPKEDAEWICQALELGIRDYVIKCGQKAVCVGLSGGIDSSVVAALAAKALGPEKVLGISLPSRFNLSQSHEDAERLATQLGIRFKTVPIEPLFEAFEVQLKQFLLPSLKPLTLENLQPRLRMAVLMAAANEEGSLLLNTSNKSEIATGYATLYGDSSGALAVLGDLTKHQVYDLARYLNREKELIPERVITRAPSAELRENQTDQDTLPPYPILDEIVERHIGRSEDLDGLAKDARLAQALPRYRRLHAQSEYKRRQLPPALRISSRAFGMGRRTPIATGPY